MYIVRQTKGISFALKEVVHNNIKTIEEAIELAKRVEAKYVEKIVGRCCGEAICVYAWINEAV